MTRALLAASLAALLPTLPACSSTPSSAAATASSSLSVGDHAPDVTLTRPDGSTVTLASLTASGPVVLNFYRGNWCPYCNKSLDQWDKAAADFHAAGASIIAVSPESLPNISKTDSAHDVTILADPSHDAARAFHVNFTVDPDTQTKYRAYGIDLAKHNADSTWDLPIPATYLIDRRGIIRYVYSNPDYTTRADPADVLAAARRLNH